jgi:hypothetical protein
MRSSTYGGVTLKGMPLRTCAKPVGTLTVKSLRELKMNDDVKIHEEIHKRYAQHLAEATQTIGAVGAIPDNRVYWSIPLSNPWTNVYKNTWEIEVEFHE